MGYITPQEQIKADDLAREATKRALEDIKRQRGLRYAGEGSTRDHSRQVRSHGSAEETAKQQELFTVIPADCLIPLQPGKAVDIHSHQPVRTSRPTPKAQLRNGLCKAQRKSPLSRLEQTLENLRLEPEGAEAQSTAHPPSAGSSTTTLDSQSKSRIGGPHALHGYGKASKGRMTPKSHSSSNSESGVVTPRSNSSMPLKALPKETGFAGKSLHEAQETLIQEFITCPKYKPFELLPSKSLEEYYAIVKTPMSLHRVLRKVGDHEFKDWQSFEECVSLVWSNAHLYYKEGSQTLSKAEDLKECFTRRLKEAMITVEDAPNILQHVNQDDRIPDVRNSGDQTPCSTVITRCMSIDENMPASPAPASVIFSDMMVEDLKGDNLSPSEIMRVVDEGWQRLSPADRETFEHQASKTAAARERTATAVAAEVDRNKVLAKAKKELVDRLMQSFYKLLGNSPQESSESLSEDSSSWESSQAGRTHEQDPDFLWSANPTVGSEDHPRTESTRHRSGHQALSNPGPTGGPNRKHGRTSQEQESDFEDDEGDGKRRKPSLLKPSDARDPSKRFACPFSKRFPAQPPKSSSCVYPGFGSVPRTKEHLYRNHLRPGYRCLRCYQAFDSEPQLRAHARAAERCPEGEELPDEQGLDAEQERKLRNKKRHGKEMSEEGKWRSIYMVCFPGVSEADVPSPYCEHQRSPSPYSVERYERFQRERLPQRVRRALEYTVETDPQLALLAERLGPRLIEIIRTCQEDVSEEYHMNGGASSRARNQNHTHTPRSVAEAQRPVSPTPLEMGDFSNNASWEQFLSAGSNVDFAFTGNEGSLAPPQPDTTYGSMSQDDSCTHISTSTSDWLLPIQNDDSAYVSRAISQSYTQATGVMAGNSLRRPYPGFNSDWQDPLPTFHGNFGEGPSAVNHHQNQIRAQNPQYGHHDVSDHQCVGAQFGVPDAGGPSSFIHFSGWRK